MPVGPEPVAEVVPRPDVHQFIRILAPEGVGFAPYADAEILCKRQPSRDLGGSPVQRPFYLDIIRSLVNARIELGIGVEMRVPDGHVDETAQEVVFRIAGFGAPGPGVIALPPEPELNALRGAKQVVVGNFGPHAAGRQLAQVEAILEYVLGDHEHIHRILAGGFEGDDAGILEEGAVTEVTFVVGEGIGVHGIAVPEEQHLPDGPFLRIEMQFVGQMDELHTGGEGRVVDVAGAEHFHLPEVDTANRSAGMRQKSLLRPGHPGILHHRRRSIVPGDVFQNGIPETAAFQRIHVLVKL